MAINYSKVGWDTTKYVNPTNMNKMDDGIKAACDGVDGITANYLKANNDVMQKIALSSGAGGTVLQLQSRATTLETWLQFLDTNGASVGSIGAKGNKPYFRDDNSVKEIALADEISVTLASSVNTAVTVALPSGRTAANTTPIGLKWTVSGTDYSKNIYSTDFDVTIYAGILRVIHKSAGFNDFPIKVVVIYN